MCLAPAQKIAAISTPVCRPAEAPGRTPGRTRWCTTQSVR